MDYIVRRLTPTGKRQKTDKQIIKWLKQTHPKLWEYCMKPWSKDGLGMKEVLESIGVKIE